MRNHLPFLFGVVIERTAPSGQLHRLQKQGQGLMPKNSSGEPDFLSKYPASARN